MLLVGPALHQYTAAPRKSGGAGAPGHAAFVPALARPLVTAGAGCEQDVPRDRRTLGQSLGAFLCLSLLHRLQGSCRAGFSQGIVAAPTPKFNPATQF